MTRPPSFEDFGAAPQAAAEPQIETTSAPDPALLRESHDAGYKLGWDDAVAASEDEQAKLRANISTALQEAGFTYFEARQHVMNSVKPLIEAVINQMLPEVARTSLTAVIVEEIIEMADKIKVPIKVRCAPECVSALEEAVTEATTFPVEIQAEETLESSQVTLTYDDGTTEFDSTALIASISQRLEDFYQNATQEERQHA